MLSYRALERIVRGFSNHRRIEIMDLLSRSPALSVFDLANKLHINFRTASEHLRRLYTVGLITKRNRGAAVEHSLTNLGKAILKFLRTLE